MFLKLVDEILVSAMKIAFFSSVVCLLQASTDVVAFFSSTLFLASSSPLAMSKSQNLNNVNAGKASKSSLLNFRQFRISTSMVFQVRDIYRVFLCSGQMKKIVNVFVLL